MDAQPHSKSPIPVSRSNVIIIGSSPSPLPSSSCQNLSENHTSLSESDAELHKLLREHDTRERADDESKPDRSVVIEETFRLLVEMREEQRERQAQLNEERAESSASHELLLPVSRHNFVIIGSGHDEGGVNRHIWRLLAAHDDRAEMAGDRIVVTESSFAVMEATRKRQIAEFESKLAGTKIPPVSAAPETTKAAPDEDPPHVDLASDAWACDADGEKTPAENSEEDTKYRMHHTI